MMRIPKPKPEILHKIYQYSQINRTVKYITKS